MTMTTGLRLISSSLTQIPTPKPSALHSQQQRQQQQPLPKTYSRRNAILFFSVLSLIKTPTATAFSLGISGPKEWLKEQKKKASKFLLAPIDASRDNLRTASSILLRETDPESSNMDLAEFRRLLKAVARDCVLEDRNSFVTFQAQTGVEVCTFRLIVKNASSLLDDRNPVKLEAEAILGDLIGSFTFLNGVLNSSDLQLASDRKKVKDVLMDTISSLDKFEQGIKNCLDA